jgi:hypothetical protein
MWPPARGEHEEESCPYSPHFTLVMLLPSGSKSESKSRREAMQVIHERCAALDVHKKTVVRTTMITQADGRVQEEVRTFLTMTADLLALDDWLRSQRIEVIAMESTGVFTPPTMLPKKCLSGSMW